MKPTTMPAPRTLVLAAGFSTRLGMPKALARVRGSSLLRRTVAVLTRVTRSQVIVVAPPRHNRYRIELHGLDATFLTNSQRHRGLSSSVRLGIKHARFSSALLLIPVDLAQLDHRDVARIMARWRGARRHVVARRIGTTGGIPLILPKRLFARALTIHGDAGLRELVNQLPAGEVLLLGLPSATQDVDTVADLQRARRRITGTIA
jgi:molybdenum cofactor cytidylyltransferase